MILGECAPCKAKRLQEEANEDFKRRYGVLTYNPNRSMNGYRPVMGQVSTPVPPPAPPAWKDLTLRRLANVGASAAVTLPLGILGATVSNRLRMSRKTANQVGGAAAVLGASLSVIPFGESVLVDGLAKACGAVMGVAAADLILPAPGAARGKAIPAI